MIDNNVRSHHSQDRNKTTSMQNLTNPSTAESEVGAIANPISLPKPNSLEEDTDPGTQQILSEIEAERDYYQSCGRW